MIPMWQMMLGLCLSVAAFLVVRQQPIAYNQEERKRHGSKPNENYNCAPGDNCAICLCNMTNDEMTYLRCGHAFHTACCRQHMQHFKTCPICRQKV